MAEIGTTAAWIVVVVLGLSVIGKLTAYRAWSEWLSKVVSAKIARLGAVAVPLFELTVCSSVLFVPPRWTAVAASALLLPATVLLARTRDVSGACACFGDWSHMSWERSLARNGLLMALCALAVAVGAQRGYDANVSFAAVAFAMALLLTLDDRSVGVLRHVH